MKHFVVGQKVVVSDGVGTITDIRKETLYGCTNTYYTIVLPDGTKHTISANHLATKCRPLSSPEQIGAAFTLLTRQRKTYKGQFHKQMKDIEGRLKKLQLSEQVQLVRDLYSVREREWTQKTPIYEQCLDNLATECGLVLGYPKDVMAGLIEATIINRAIPDSLDFE